MIVIVRTAVAIAGAYWLAQLATLPLDQLAAAVARLSTSSQLLP